MGWIKHSKRTMSSHGNFYHEVIGEFAKNEYNRGALTFMQMTAIWERYGTAG